MAKNKLKILAIDPGTREMGYAFLDKGKLLYYGVKVIGKKKSPHGTLKEGRKIVLRLINDLKPNLLAVEKTFVASNRNAALLNVLFDEIKAIGKRKKLRVLSFAPSTVKKHIAKDGWARKEEVARAIATKYPELKVYLTQDRGWKERYHQNMFDAVALAEMALEQS
ncbi:MAG: crossover junction endodeoxyribonuclease RuvC [Candidatus Aerophobetes bacterium]|nr:crossover junction endodeoxyribonuclease RuvC [Candidatus Aerophobetes bacterium]